MARAELKPHWHERVVKAAITVFARRGYQATSVTDLCAAGKIGVGNFYSLFGSKEGCFIACFESVAKEAQARVEAAGSSQEDWAARTYLGLGAALSYLREEPLCARLVLVESQSAGVESAARYEATLDRAVAWLASGRAIHPGARELPPGFEQASIAGLAYYLQQRLLDASILVPAELLSEAATLLLEPVVGRDRLVRLAAEAPAATLD